MLPSVVVVCARSEGSGPGGSGRNAPAVVRYWYVTCVFAEHFSSSAGPRPHASVSQMNGICCVPEKTGPVMGWLTSSSFAWPRAFARKVFLPSDSPWTSPTRVPGARPGRNAEVTSCPLRTTVAWSRGKSPALTWASTSPPVTVSGRDERATSSTFPLASAMATRAPPRTSSTHTIHPTLNLVRTGEQTSIIGSPSPCEAVPTIGLHRSVPGGPCVWASPPGRATARMPPSARRDRRGQTSVVLRAPGMPSVPNRAFARSPRTLNCAASLTSPLVRHVTGTAVSLGRAHGVPDTSTADAVARVAARRGGRVDHIASAGRWPPRRRRGEVARACAMLRRLPENHNQFSAYSSYLDGIDYSFSHHVRPRSTGRTGRF